MSLHNFIFGGSLADSSIPKFKKGGGVSIENQYEGKTAEDVWNGWEEKQRIHFMVDHFFDLLGYYKKYVKNKRDENSIFNSHAKKVYDELSEYNNGHRPKDAMLHLAYGDVKYNELPLIVKETLEFHVRRGQYSEGGGVAKGWTDAELMAKGGGVKQKGTSDTSLDKLEKAKRVGYRFTDKKAKQLHVNANAKPTEEEIKKMKHGKGVYYENRKNRSDKSRMKKLEDGGGVAKGWTDAELKEKGGVAKAKKKGGGNSGMMAKIQSGAKAIRAEHPNMKWTDCIKKSASNLKEKGQLHN